MTSHLELRLAAAVVRASQHRDVGVVAARRRASRAARCSGGPGSRRARPSRTAACTPRPRRARRSRRDAAEVAADVARGQPGVAAERDEDVREVLADAGAAGEHLGDGALDRRRADDVVEPLAHVVGGAPEEGERASRRGRRRGARRRWPAVSSASGTKALGPRNSASSSSSAASPRELARASATRPAPRRAGPASGSSAPAWVTTSLVDSIMRWSWRYGDAEVVHRVAVVVAEGDHGRGRLDREVEVEQRLRRALRRGWRRTSLKLSNAGAA